MSEARIVPEVEFEKDDLMTRAWVCLLAAKIAFPYVHEEDKALASMALRKAWSRIYDLPVRRSVLLGLAYRIDTCVREILVPRGMWEESIRYYAFSLAAETCFVFDHDDVVAVAYSVDTLTRMFLLLRHRGSEALYEETSKEVLQFLCYQVRTLDLEASGEPLADWVLENYPTARRQGSLQDALVRAKDHRLSWWNPAERALAERCTDIPALWSQR